MFGLFAFEHERMSNHSFETAFYRYSAALERLSRSSSDIWLCREASGSDDDGRFILRTAPEAKIATVFSDGSVELHNTQLLASSDLDSW